MMRSLFVNFFIYSASVLLFFTAFAKLISGFGASKVLQLPDPVFGLEFRYLFWFGGGLELAIALCCLFGKVSICPRINKTTCDA